MTATVHNPAGIAASEIWCGIPVYNNAATIAEVAKQCRAQLPNILVIDDGSTDADLRELLRPLDIHVIRHPVNRGKGAALLTAFQFARDHGGRYLITLDGDGQHFPDDLPRLVSQIEPDTLIIGSRDETVGERPRSSRFGQAFSDFWITIETGHSARDTQSGFRCYPLEPLAKLNFASRHYNFEVEVVTRSLWGGLHVASAPIRVAYSAASSAGSNFRPLLDNFRLSRLHTRLVLRQLLPIPHRKLTTAPRHPAAPGDSFLLRLFTQHATPLGLAAAVALGILLGLVLRPFGAAAILYVAWRLHLNKVAALFFAALATFLPPTAACLALGRWTLQSTSHDAWAWFIGSHIVAFLASTTAALITYTIAQRLRPQAQATRSPS
jgi:hypothetical protein